MPIALLILGSLLGWPDDPDVTIGGGTLIIGIVPGAVMGVVLHELVHGVFFLVFGGRPRFGFKPWTRLGPVFYAGAPGSYFTKLEYAASGPCAGSSADGVVGRRLGARGRKRRARLRRRMGPPA